MLGRLRAGALLALALAAAGTWMLLSAVTANAHRNDGREQGGDHGRQQGHVSHGRVSHVVLISVDGLHQSDLTWYVSQHPNSTLAQLYSGGAEYSRALTPVPSDSFPGMVGQVTGGNPGTTGVYYDAEYNHNLLPPGSACPSSNTGTAVDYFEIIDKDPSALDAGEGRSPKNQPDTIFNMSGNPLDGIDATKLPLDPSNCQPIYPHQYIKVNTIFGVARQHGLRTAWSDKHVAYDILNGPYNSRTGPTIQDQFSPEINSDAYHSDGTPYGGDWTKHNSATRQYDHYKVQAVINEINGYDHSGKTQVGEPAIFGMNFQTISTAQKLPQSEAVPGGPVLNGGYLPGTHTPGPLLSDALNWLDGQLGSMYAAIQHTPAANSTAIILSAKHGQSPIDPSTLFRTDDGAIIDGINAACGNIVATDTIAGGPAGSRDDAFPLWLTDRSQAAANCAANYLWTHPVTGNTYNAANPSAKGPTTTRAHSGLQAIFAGKYAARYFGVSPSDPRHPDLWGVVQHGVVYTGGAGKIAEHGGADFEDRNVPILVYAPSEVRSGRYGNWVETTSIAPTILQLLGLNPGALQAVQIEGTPVLPGIGGREERARRR